jgi:hypothetical protein
VGELAAAGRDVAAQLHHPDDARQRALRADPQPDAGDRRPRELSLWLGEQEADEVALNALLAPYLEAAMECYRVGTEIGNVRNDTPALIAPLAV